jgi:quinol monooxygenase YgiN
MIDVTIKMTVPPPKREEILQTIKAILASIRLEPGCLSCNCYVDVEMDSNFCFAEKWRNRKDMEAHLRSAHFGILLGAMSLLEENPEIRFDTISATAKRFTDRNKRTLRGSVSPGS